MSNKIKATQVRTKKYGEPTMLVTFRFPVSKEIEVRYTMMKLLESYLIKSK